jgi:photosystem II stability/assembly factor-like uncharacterized protein
MRNRLWILFPLLCVWLASCNFPTPRSSTLPMSGPSEPAVGGIHPAATRTETAGAALAESTATASPTVKPTAGPIPRLPDGTALAVSYIDMIDADTGWSIGGDADSQSMDHVLRTLDGGSAWKDVTPPENTVVEPATERIAVGGFWDADNALVTFYSANLLPPPSAPVVWITSNGGATWRASAPLDLSGWVGEYRVSDVFFININTAWVLVHKGDDPAADRIALFQTLNGGNTWQRVVDPAIESPLQECEKTGILFTGPWNGWLTGDCRGNRAGVFLFQTFDGGKSWIEAKLPSPATPPGMFTSPDFACRIRPPVFFAQDTNLILPVECASKATPTTAAYMYASNLDGSNWHIMPYPGGQLIIRSPGDGRVFRGDVVSGLAVGKDLYMYNGQSGEWEKLNSIDWTGQFDFIDWNKGWAAARRGETALLMYTSDGGRSWKALAPATAA